MVYPVMVEHVYAQDYGLNMSFPSEEFNEEEDPITRRCTSFGEAAVMIANDPNVFGKTDFFKCFYNVFTENSTI